MMGPGEKLTIRRQVIACIVLASAVFLPCPVSAADNTKAEDLGADIVYRCYNQMGEFGPEGVEVCMKGELSAMQALKTYPQEASEIVQRCTKRLEPIGWEMVKSCADKEIAAARKAKKD
jgi:hypothetical protein